MQIADGQKDDIVRVAAWRRRDYDLIAIRSPPHENALVMPYLAEPFQTSPESSLGSLKYLPAEIISMIYRELDVLSLFRLRQVNRHARIAVSELLEYKTVASNALDCLRAVLRTGRASHLNFRSLYQYMCCMKCTQCNFFGGYLLLLTLERCCYTCLQMSSYLEVVTLPTFSRASGLSQSRLSCVIPIVRTIPGVYTIWEKEWSKRIKITSKKAAVRLLGEQNLGRDITDHEFRQSNREEIYRHMAAVRIPHWDTSTASLQPTFSCKGCLMALGKPRLHYDPGNRHEREYLKDDFLDHFQECRGAQNLWIASLAGTKELEELPLIKRGGFIYPPDSSGDER